MTNSRTISVLELKINDLKNININPHPLKAYLIESKQVYVKLNLTSALMPVPYN